ncbi:pentapeptide repeat-containing protein [Kitasatospora acidiphila]|uniref:pentapeptide repeat-containing protein n=1 Tax=Kitasatospora acidiphila TaxID=2567942 RepID=UPI0038996269
MLRCHEQWKRVSLRRASLQRADLQRADLRQADLRRAGRRGRAGVGRGLGLLLAGRARHRAASVLGLSAAPG